MWCFHPVFMSPQEEHSHRCSFLWRYVELDARLYRSQRSHLSDDFSISLTCSSDYASQSAVPGKGLSQSLAEKASFSTTNPFTMKTYMQSVTFIVILGEPQTSRLQAGSRMSVIFLGIYCTASFLKWKKILIERLINKWLG